MHNDLMSTSIEYATMYNYHIQLAFNPAKEIKMLHMNGCIEVWQYLDND